VSEVAESTRTAETRTREQNAQVLRRRHVLRDPGFVIGVIMLAVVILVAIFADLIAPHGYAEQNLADKLLAPCAEYPLGTDMYGRCIFSRIIYGSRIALRVGLIAVAIECVIGVVLGTIAGYYGGVADKIISFFTDMVWSIPPIIFAMAIVLLVGASAENVAFAIAVVTWAQIAKVVRAKTRTICSESYIDAARTYGESDLSILVRYVMPNLLSTIVIMASLSLPSAILSTTSMSFLGLGAQEPLPDWGMILSGGIKYIRSAPWISMYPGIAIVWTVLGFNLVSEGVRDLLDPTLEV
jgi:peptide/nickel transport system permease protein